MAEVIKDKWIITEVVFVGFINLLHQYCPEKSKNELRRLVKDKAVKYIGRELEFNGSKEFITTKIFETTFVVDNSFQNVFTDPIDQIDFDHFCERCLGGSRINLGYFKLDKRTTIHIIGEKILDA
jgi:hypothetical protein